MPIFFSFFKEHTELIKWTHQFFKCTGRIAVAVEMKQSHYSLFNNKQSWIYFSGYLNQMYHIMSLQKRHMRKQHQYAQFVSGVTLKSLCMFSIAYWRTALILKAQQRCAESVHKALIALHLHGISLYFSLLSFCCLNKPFYIRCWNKNIGNTMACNEWKDFKGDTNHLWLSWMFSTPTLAKLCAFICWYNAVP